MFLISVWQLLSNSIGWSILLLILILSIVFYISVTSSNLPPGPIGLPLVGFYPFIRNDSHVQFAEFAKRYGDVFTFRVMGQLYINLCTYEAVKEAHVAKADFFENRPEPFSIFSYIFGDGVAFLNGPAWKEQRKFSLFTLKEFGFGKLSFESLIHDAIQQTLEALKLSDEKPYDILQILNENCTSIVTQLFFSGKAGGILDEEIKELNRNFDKMMNEIRGPNQLLSGWLFKYLIFPFMSEYKPITEGKAGVDSVLQEIVEEHQKTFDKDNLRDFVDFYLEQKRKLEEKGDRKADFYTVETLKSSLLQMFGDGGMSIASFIHSLMRDLMDQPEVQKRIQKELDDVVGKERLPSWTDRSNLPYTEAAILEHFRNSLGFPYFISHQCTRETTIQGYRIPKGVITVVNSWLAHHDPKVHEDPDKFDPCRYLGPDGQRNKTELPITFGIGKRSCAGESLVNMELFLFVTSILQNYTIMHPKGKELKKVSPAEVLKYELCAIPRRIE